MSQPGQLNLNELEVAILQRIASDNPDSCDMIRRLIATAHVLSREFTGVGCFTNIKYDGFAATEDIHVGLETTISIPRLAHGLGAIVFFKIGQPAVLEIYAFGGEEWDGTIDGFAIK